jgi:hypothetical protein
VHDVDMTFATASDHARTPYVRIYDLSIQDVVLRFLRYYVHGF